MALALLVRRLPDQDSDLLEKASYVDSLIDRSIDAVHRISGDLRPAVLDFGLIAAIEWHAKEFEKQMGILCEVSSNVEEIDLDVDQATALFRIFQEALTNVSKHADASRVEVRLIRTIDHLRLEIADNGKGMAPVDRVKEKSFGLRGMKERALALGGQLTIDAAPFGGTVIVMNMPMSPEVALGEDY